MKKIYLIFALFFGLTLNMSAQETVVAVWDFADNSIVGDIHPDFSGAANPDMTYLTGGGAGAGAFTNTDVEGGDFDYSYTMSTTSSNTGAWSNFVLNNLHLGPTTGTPTPGSGLVNDKLHLSLSFKSITLDPTTADKITFIMKDANSGTGTNHRITGLQIKKNPNANNMAVYSMIYNAGNANATSKLCGHFGATQGMTLTDVTIGVTVDYAAGSIRFWINSPDSYASGDGNAWGFKMFNADGYANTNNFPALTATPSGNSATGLANAVVQMLQFSPVITGASEFVFDQIKISTGEYENTVAAGNTPPATPPALEFVGVIDFNVGGAGFGGNDGKGLHLYANEDIADLSAYALHRFSNGDTAQDSAPTAFPTASVTAGQHILIARNIEAMDAYMGASNLFDVVIAHSQPSMNGNDFVTLTETADATNTPIDTFGVYGDNPDTTGSGCDYTTDPDCWDHEDAWAYKGSDGVWTYGAVNCTDGTITTWDSDCVYPFAADLTHNPRSVITFEDYPVAGDTWNGDAGQIASIVADPDTSGVDHGNVGKMELSETGDPWQNSQLSLAGGTYAVNLLDGTTKRVIFEMWSETATCGLLKFEQGLNGAGNKELGFNVSGNGWETIVVDFTDGGHDGSAVNGEYNKIVLFFNYCDAAGNPTGTAPDVRYIDNISYLQGTYNEPPFNPGPAPTPTAAAEDVISIYSDTYTQGVTQFNINPGWGQATALNQVTVAEGDQVIFMENLNYQGHTFDAVDLSSMTHVHFDYYNNGVAFGSLPFSIINTSAPGGTVEQAVTTDASTVDTWVQVDIALSDYTNMADLLGAIDQLKWGDANGGSIYIDNLYFYYDATAGIDDLGITEFTYFPNPVNDMLTINAQSNIKDITVYNMLGQIVVRQSPNASNCTVDMSTIQTGAYFVQVSIGNSIETVRVLKK